ncbi:monocarboxylate transporter 14-like [Watersipora subatra]|uniref:monocarboxylate transporter 14-like n=1 Tax=Watersipora subatra TaxID=2589382 RepID=UPI00355BFF8E
MEEEAKNTVPDLNGFKLHSLQKRGNESGSLLQEKVADEPDTEIPEDLEVEVHWEDYIPEPPDGGWGWVIMIASFFNNFLVDGIAYCFGVFLAEYVEYFNTSVGNVSLSSSLLCGFYLFVGPVVAAFVNKWGCRKVGIVGSLIATSAFLISTFSPNIFMFQCTYGILGGFGFGLMYLPAVVGVGYYFEKKRALATGIAVCGTGIGTFAMAPLAKYTLDELDWKNSHYVLAGLLLQGCVFSALMRPLTARRKITKNSYDKSDDKKPLTDSREKPSTAIKNRRDFTQSSHTLRVAEKVGSVQRLHASAFIDTTQRSFKELTEDMARPMYRKDIFFSGSICNIPGYKTTENNGDNAERGASVMSLPSEKPHGRLSCLNSLPKPMADVLAEMLDLDVLGNKSMLALCLGNLFGMLGFYVPILFSTNRAMQKGVDKEKAALLLSIMGACNTVGRVLSGLMVVFIPKLSPLAVNNASITMAGLAVMLTPFCNTFGTMALAIAAYGLFAASFIALSSILVCDAVGLEKLTNGFGLICLVRGIAAMAGPPIEGMLYDLTGDYDATFYMGGACILTSAGCQMLLFLKPFAPKKQDNLQK